MPIPQQGGDSSESAERMASALEDVTDKLDSFADAVEFGVRAAQEFGNKTFGFAANAGFKAAQRFGRDTAIQAASEFVRLGGSASERVTSGALEAASHIPILGSLFGDVTQPLNAAASRTAGITTMIAKAGGEVTPELRAELFRLNLEQEKRAHEELKQVDRHAGGQEALGQALNATRLGEAIDRLIVTLDRIDHWFGGK